MKSTRIDLTGKQFGNLTVIGHHHTFKKKAFWLCRCNCGQETIARGRSLKNGRKKSCAVNGHHWRERRGTGYRHSAEYKIWRTMKGRCLTGGGKKTQNYGDRGIRVCDRWNSSFRDFLADMGPKPGPYYSIERKDVNGHYEPGNCIWIPLSDQARNRRNSVYVNYDGHDVLLLDLCAELGLPRGVIYGRIKNGWPLEEAISVPLVRYRRRKAA